jgi:glycosyltransferase involved in cell wall biosynthesis
MILLEMFPLSKGRQFHLIQHDEGLYHVDRKLADRAFTSHARKIVVSTWLKDIMRDTYKQESDLLLNPVDKTQFRQLPRTADQQTVRVLLLHHTYEWKGTAEGVAAVRAVQARHPEVRLILFGVRQKDDVDLSYDEYHYNVSQDKLATLYSNTDIYLCPSWDEGYGLPSVEAMACGAALVTYDNGGSRDYAYHEQTALVAKRRDTADLERQLERMVCDAETRHRIAKEGQNFVRNMPDWEARTDELEKILVV